MAISYDWWLAFEVLIQGSAAYVLVADRYNPFKYLGAPHL
jgi:hypothetical protein